MEFCPVCKSEVKDSLSTCPVCSSDLSTEEKSEWKSIGSIEDKISADYAEETLKSYEIPVVIISRSGFFGAAGLNLNPFHTKTSGLFNVMVLKDDTEEAIEILRMILGDTFIIEDN